jgi:hypothetical protein
MGSLCTRTIVLRECEYGIKRNRRIFCRIELAVPLVVDELIVACDCDHGLRESEDTTILCAGRGHKQNSSSPIERCRGGPDASRPT